MAPPDKSQYGKLSVGQTVGLIANLVPLPAIVLWNALTTSYASFNRDRTFKRILGDSVLRYVTALSVPQLQAAFGTDEKAYAGWTNANKQPSTIDDLGSDARLLWIGPKRTERVVLLLHGGAFLLPVADFSLSFWRYVQVELEKQGIEVGFACLEYTLAPYATFPTPLKQAAIALNFLLEAGVQPSNLAVAGDSAGANLALQLLSHSLHPLPNPDIPRVTLSSPLRGAFLISPWVSLSASSKSHKENNGLDFLSERTLRDWGAQILKDVPAEQIPFAEAVRAPENWFDDADKVYQRVLISAGGAECLRDDILAFADAFKKKHKDTEVVVQRGGIHDDMYLDFFFGEKKLGSVTPLAISWLAAGFSA